MCAAAIRMFDPGDSAKIEKDGTVCDDRCVCFTLEK